MRSIIIENVDLMSEDEEKQLKDVLTELNCGFKELDHNTVIKVS